MTDNREEREFGIPDEYEAHARMQNFARPKYKELLTEWVRNYKQENENRAPIGGGLFLITALWLIFVGCCVVWTGQKNTFKLADSVLVALLTSTTVNVLGLFVLVTKFLFGGSPSSKADFAAPDMVKFLLDLERDPKSSKEHQT